MCLEKYIVEQCAPTLASLKTGTLFGVMENDAQELMQQVSRWQRELSSKGLILILLRYRNGRALIYLGRLSQLARDLSAPGAEKLLKRCGYEALDIEGALECLRERVCTQDIFPHEIGLFLGYPIDDVIGFMRYGGKGSKYTGCWQVYGDVQEAAEKFGRYRKCSKIYKRLYGEGLGLKQLTVSA